MLSEHYHNTVALVSGSQFLYKWLLCDTTVHSLKDFMQSLDKQCVYVYVALMCFLYPLYWYLTYCFSYLSDFFPLWSLFVIVFPVSNVTLTHLLPSQQNPIFADTLPASASVNMFSKSHWCFFSPCANGRLVIRLIILIHLDRIKPSCKRNSNLEVMSYSKEFPISVPWMQISETIYRTQTKHYACSSVEWIMCAPLVSIPLLIWGVSDINPSVAWWRKM